ncbi:MAG: sigma-70 family RNA polymerase sigma factor [Myxococcales bacterium]|nr:sigma-70 family RNA polymerase sigma factor [Myxococcales bacterium]
MPRPPDDARREALADAMGRYADGDARAFDHVYRELAPAVRACLHRWTGPSHVDDLCQKTFLRVHRARHRYRPGAPVGAWVLTIARNLAIDELRKRGTQRDRTTPEGELPDVAAEPPEPEPDAEVIAAVRDAIAQLPESQRRVIELHKLDERPFAEIAAELGINEGAARVRAHRAYDKLRKLLGPKD